MKQKCKVCGANAESELCFRHKKSNLRPKLAPRRHFQLKEVETTNEMPAFFLSIWKKRGHFSEISGVFLGNTPNTMFFHHILLKSVVPEAMLDEENIILLTPEEHGNVHLNETRYEKINNQRDYLKEKYHIFD